MYETGCCILLYNVSKFYETWYDNVVYVTVCVITYGYKYTSCNMAGSPQMSPISRRLSVFRSLWFCVHPKVLAQHVGVIALAYVVSFTCPVIMYVPRAHELWCCFVCVLISPDSHHMFIRMNPREPAATARRPLRIGVFLSPPPLRLTYQTASGTEIRHQHLNTMYVTYIYIYIYIYNVCIHTCVQICMNIYIYIHREREINT